MRRLPSPPEALSADTGRQEEQKPDNADITISSDITAENTGRSIKIQVSSLALPQSYM